MGNTRNIDKEKIIKKGFKGNNGITLIALVITILVILILAGVTIATLTGDNGLLQKAGETKNTSQDAEIEEEIRLAWNKVYMDSYLDSITDKVDALEAELKGSEVHQNENEDFLDITYKGKTISINTTTGEIKQPLPVITAGQKAPATSNAQYKSGNYTAIIPAGFTVSDVKVVNETTGKVEKDETTIETGLVIRDDPGNEFVWIPVGIPWKSVSNKIITLGRYVFDSEGNINTTLSKKEPEETISISPYNFTEGLKNSDIIDNLHAKDIKDFIDKTNKSGGFWIGRYEARVEGYKEDDVKTTNTSNLPSWTGYTGGRLVEKGTAQVFNYITQNKAAELSRGMYENNNYFESDLINSYAWDTATLFLQEYDNRTYNKKMNDNYREKYSLQIRLSGGLKNTGTNASGVAGNNSDKICNVYDMADNCMEWTTETCRGTYCSFVKRGGSTGYPQLYTSIRNNNIISYSNDISFRPILYVK